MEKHIFIDPKNVELKLINDDCQELRFIVNGKKHNLSLVHSCKPAEMGTIIEWAVLQEKLTQVNTIELSRVTDFWAVEIWRNGTMTHIRCEEINGLC